MELLRKAKNKIVEVAFGPSGEEFKIHQQTLAKLEVQINAIKASLSHYAKATVSLSAAACSAASEVNKFYADSKARAKSIKLFTDSNFKMEAISEELYKDQYSRDILKPLDDWIDEIKQTKKLISQAIQVSEQVHQQDEKVKSLAATKDKRGAKGQSLSNKEEQTAEQEEQRLEKYTKLYTQMKATIDKNVKGLTEGRYARFDACFVRLMECQVEYFRHGVSQTEGFLPNIDNYRRRFPRKTPTVAENGVGTISPPTSNSGPSVVIENVDAGFPDLSSPTAQSAEDSAQDWDGLKDTSAKPGDRVQSEEAARKRREERKKEAEAEARSAAAVKAKAEAEGKLKKEDSDIPTQDFLSGFSTGTIPPTPPSSGRGVKETRKKISVATEPTVPEDEGPASAPPSYPAKTSFRPPQLNIFEQVDYTPDDNAPVAPALASPKSPLSPMIPSIDGIFIGADGEQPEFDLFNQEKEPPSKPTDKKQGKKNDGIVPPTPPPSARGGRKGPGLDLSELHSAMNTLAVTSPHSSVVPPTPPPSARGTKPPLTGVLDLSQLESSLNQLASQSDEDGKSEDGEISTTSSITGVGSNRPDRTGSFDIDRLAEMFTSESDLVFSPPSSSKGAASASARHGGLPSVLESFDPFNSDDSAPTTTNSSPTKKAETAQRKEYTPAPDPGLASEIDDELPASKSEKETRSAVEKFRDSNKAHEQAQEEKRKVSATLEAKLNAWEFKDGTQKNIRTLLNSLDTLLWEGAGWKKPGIMEMSDTDGLRKVVRKARLLVHPDKVATGTYEQQVIAERVFETLNTSFQLFEQSGQK